MLTRDKKPVVPRAGKPVTTRTMMQKLSFSFHPVTTVKRSAAWLRDLISAIIDHIIVITFFVVFSIISRIKFISPETRQRLVDIVQPRRIKPLVARYGIIPPPPQPTRRPKDDGRVGRPPLPPRKNIGGVQQRFKFLPLTSDSDDEHRHIQNTKDLMHNDAASDTVVGSVHEMQLADEQHDDIPSPTASTTSSRRDEEMQKKLQEAEQEARDIKSRAQRLADGMVSSASALHDTWIQDAHRQYSSIVSKAREDVDKLTVESETLRSNISDMQAAMMSKTSIERATQTEQDDVADEVTQTDLAAATESSGSQTAEATVDVTTQTTEELLMLSRPGSPLGTPRKYSSLITDRDVAAAMPSTPSRPSASPMGHRPNTSIGMVTPSSSPASRVSSQRKRPKSMDVVETLASLSPASYKEVMEEVAQAEEKEMANKDQVPAEKEQKEKKEKRHVVRDLVEKGHRRLFHHQHSASEGGIVGVARSTSNKLRKENRKSMGSEASQ